MLVSELKNILSTIPDEAVVVMSSDGEGNNFSPLSSYTHKDIMYVPDSTWSGEIWSEEDEREWDGDIPDDAEVAPPANAVKCVILWPVN